MKSGAVAVHKVLFLRLHAIYLLFFNFVGEYQNFSIDMMVLEQ